MRFAIATIACLAILDSAPAAEPKREAFDDAIDKGLEYLARQQGNNGAWASRQGADPAVTSLCVLSFMSAGNVPGEGKYGAVVDRGIRYVLDQQQRNGLLATALMGQLEMYQHGICTLMLAEAVGMLPDRREAKRLREKLLLAVEIILKAQVRSGEDRGGWRYTMRSNDSDISVTGWQIMALRAAKNVGCDIPAQHVDEAIKYINRCRDASSGGYRYQRFGQVTVPCTGTSMLALSLLDKKYLQPDEKKPDQPSEEACRAASYMLKNPLNPRQQHFFYGVYYGAQAMFQIGIERKADGDRPLNYWSGETGYRRSLHDLLLRQNPPKAAGFWSGFGWDDSNVGPNYCTAMAILALTVEYRFLPIYQRSEEPAEK